MHNRFRAVAAICISIQFLPASSFATPVLDALDFSSPREKSMGGRHVALADDFSVLLDNPAGLADAPRTFSAADLGIQVIGPIFDIANLFSAGTPTPETIGNFLTANPKLFAGVDISGPLALGYTGGGLGFGLFNKTRATINLAGTNLGVKTTEDILLSSGYAFRIDLGKDHSLAIGMSAKGFIVGEITKTLGVVEAYGVISSNPMSLLSSTFTLTTGIGIDAGLRWSWKNQVAAGLVFRDAYSPAISTSYKSGSEFLSNPSGSKNGSSTFGTLPSSLDFGLMWAPDLGRLQAILDSLTFVIDYRDILGLFDPVPRNAILNVGIGAETRVLEIIYLRGGVSDALLNAGAGLDLGIFALNFAIFGTEIGRDPGDRPCYNLLVDFDFKY